MMNYKNTWKNKEVFQKQLALNERELLKYPFHWNCFLQAFNKLKEEPKSLLDVGCGCGVFSELCKRHFPNLKYRGIDYSEEAIDVASKRWDADWHVRDYRDLTEDDRSFDTLHAGAMLDVLPDADDALRFIVGLGFKNLILGRMKIIEGDSRVETYEAYDLITTYAFYHNLDLVDGILLEHNYNYNVIGTPDNATLVASKEELKLD